MEIVWNKLVVWIIAIIVLLIVLFFLFAQLKVGGDNPISAILGLGKDNLG